VRIRLVENGFVFNFGLEEDQDTYNIAFMSKKKVNPNHVTQGTANELTDLTTKIGETLSILKGGKAVQVRRPTKNRGEVEVEYKLGTKTYTINGNYNQKTGQLSITKVVEGTPAAT
jgi:hypothetical protein